MSSPYRGAPRGASPRAAAWALRAFAVGLLAALALALPSVAVGGIWAPIASGTAEEISAVEYQGADRFWYATTNGRLAYRAGGAFNAGAGPGPGIVFTDIAFQPAPGLVGVAVGNSNNVWRSVDGGLTWTKLVMPPTINNDDCFGDAEVGASAWDNGFSVTWAGAGVVYLTGDKGNIMKSVDAGATFAEVNKKPTNDDGSACRLGKTVHTDGVFISETIGWFIARSFGETWFTDTGLTTNASHRADAINNFDGVPRLAIDPTNPNRLWAVDRCRGCLSYSQDGSITYRRQAAGQLDIKNDQGEALAAPHDVAFAGGTVLLAGSGGQIATSVDGENFFYQDADSPLATADWKAVDLADAANGAVGGSGGALVVTAQGNTVPDLEAPTGTIAGPDKPIAGRATTFTANVVDPAGGSGIDPNGFTWTAPGLPAATGPNPALTFPSTGTITIKVTFRDLAGNAGEATKTVTVQPKPRQRIVPRAVPRRDAVLPFRFVLTGRVRPPTGVARAEVCRGRVTVVVRAGGRLVVRRRAVVRPNCRFRLVVTIRSRAKVRRAPALVITFTKARTPSTRPAAPTRLRVRVR